MQSTLREIQERLQHLDIEEKHTLLRTLLDDLEPPFDEEIERAWILEAQRRYQESVEGRATFVPASVVFERIRSRRKP